MSAAQEFFSEREHIVAAKSGAEYVQGLKNLLEGAETLDQGGLIPAPYGSDSVRYFFRGQATGSYGLNSSLYRTLKSGLSPDATPKQIEQDMVAAEKRVLDEARAQGIGRNLTALELLTVLQHHLIPTRLIDVSASWKVALYFASELHDSFDGRIFVVGTRPSLWEEFARSKGQHVEWPNPEAHPWQQTTWPVILPFTDPRMISQQGYFLVGGLTTNVGGHHQYWNDTKIHPPKGNQKRAPLTQQELRDVSTLMIKFPMIHGAQGGPLAKLERELKGNWTAAGLTIPVPGDLKPEIRKVLDDHHGIGEDSIYPPVDESLRLLKRVAGTRP
ncbi:FRG domain-containing protein (plasmid) [Herbiconiux sp. KACC 21604]|uniref:FRG domain-containing protein n=1 Tax=unclassified Herbiconiux TaxID=2618217 RepID=UPI001490FAE4|nr:MULTISPECIES: FRG domain-containing protein [unclassified Herbiconiux]QJU56261.1 FRG domain-containing protein [Herbiconiux sp. SALV-R1]WPO88875.1 FRG domain-containing protein [Herbiconiux sp. KACC 21604]